MKTGIIRRRTGRALLWVGGIAAGLLLLARFVGSPIATRLVNKRLAALPGYPGHVGAVQLALWRGKVTATDFTLVQKGHEDNGPVLKVGQGAFTLDPLKLLRGKVSGRVAISDVEIVMIQEPPKEPGTAKEENKEKKATHEQGGRAWQALLQENFPVDMTRFEVSNLKVTFIDRGRALAPRMLLEKVRLVAHDFKTKPQQSGDLPAKLELDGHFPGGGDLKAEASADSTAADPTFHATLEVKNMALVPMHDFLQSYALADVKRGTFDLYVEVTAKGGGYDGYLKPFFRDLDFKSVPNPEKNFLQNTAARIASAAQNLLKNSDDKVATKAPFQGNFAGNRVDIWQTLENLLRNAFVSALREGFEGQKPAAG